MLHFVAGVYNSLFSTPEYHVLIVGRECAGKSTLLEQLKFLYNPSIQQREAERRATHSESTQSPAEHSTAPTTPWCSPDNATALSTSSSTLAAHQQEQQVLPPGTPLRATSAYMAQKRIRPTVGLNYAVVQHRFSPPVTVVSRVRKSSLYASALVASLPPPPEEAMAEQRARQQALLANAPSDVVTRVVLRDLGGQTALRDLWEKYYAQTQALVYVVDSTLPFRSPAVTAPGKAGEGTGTAAFPLPAPPQPSSSPPDHFTRKELEELYRPDRQLLAQLLQHPLLQGVPVLLLSNKVDETQHMQLATVQEAMQLADLAADRAFYVREHVGNDATPTDVSGVRDRSNTSLSQTGPQASAATSSTSADRIPTLSRHCAQPEAVQRRVGESGFGEVALRIVEISAMDGAGVAGAMDWLVAQLLYHARSVSADA
jgi:GTPase SAR1 family protein